MTNPLRAVVDAIAKDYTAYSTGDVDRISGVIRQRLERTHPHLVSGATSGSVDVHVHDHFRERDARHRRQFYREEFEGMVSPIWEGVLSEMPIIGGTSYSDHPHPEVYTHLENARLRGTRLKITYGDVKTGRSWEDPSETEQLKRRPGWIRAYGALGKIGRSMGPTKIPLEIPTARSMGGGGLLVSNIVKIEHANKKHGGLIWQHPKYHVGSNRVGDASAGGPPTSVGEAILQRIMYAHEDVRDVIEQLTRPDLDEAEKPAARLIDSVRPHDRVTYLIHAGTGRNGPEWKQHTGRVVMVKPSGHDHLVVNGGGRHGTPHVVTHDTLLKVHTRKVDGPRPLPATAKRDPHGFSEAKVRDTANELGCEHCGGRAKFSYGTAGKMHYACTTPTCGKITSKRVLGSAGATADPYGSRFLVPPSRR